MPRPRPPVPVPFEVGTEPDRCRWRTPPSLFAMLDREFHFDLDAAADAANALCPKFLDREANCTRQVRWPGDRAFMNPPWGAACTACPGDCGKDHAHHSIDFPGTKAFTDAAIWQADHGVQVVLLLDAATDTGWWRDLFRRASEVRLLPRVSYLTPNGEPGPQPPGGSSIFVLDPVRKPVRCGLWHPVHGWGV